MLKVEIPYKLKDKITDNILKDISKREFNKKKYKIKYISNTISNRQFITCFHEDEKFFILFSGEEKAGGRNSFLSQYFSNCI